MQGRKWVRAFELLAGQVVVIPEVRGTCSGLTVARIKPGDYKSYLLLTFKGGRHYNLHRNTPVRILAGRELDHGKA